MDFVEDDRIPIQDIIDKITPPEIVKAETRKVISFNPTGCQIKSPDLTSRVFKKKLTF